MCSGLAELPSWIHTPTKNSINCGLLNICFSYAALAANSCF
jgi:hypothetical protein